jgi:sensor histidine kinase YesM
MEKEQSIAELTYLKAQINPHFLFNSLNSLYAQLEAGSKDTKGTLMALADLLRFQLYDCDADFIPLKKEIEYLQNYFTLQSIRKDNCVIAFVVDEVPADTTIAPLLLVPFIENAFKYVSDYDGMNNYIRAALKLNGDELYFYCSNTTQEKKAQTAPCKGIGINNVAKRLRLIYGDSCSLTTGFKDALFDVALKIKLK